VSGFGVETGLKFRQPFRGENRPKQPLTSRHSRLTHVPPDMDKELARALLTTAPLLCKWQFAAVNSWTERLSRAFPRRTALKSSADDPSGEICQAQWKNESGPYSRVALLLNEIGTGAS
jgi:hypothetical protein